MARTMFEQLAALREPEPAPMRKGLLPKREHKLTSTSKNEPVKVPKLVPNPTYDPNGHPASYKRHQKRLERMVAPTLHHDLIISSRRAQALTGQSENVEKHMNLQKPTRQLYPDPILAHDRAMDWTPPSKDEYRRIQIRDRANAALRAALMALPDED